MVRCGGEGGIRTHDTVSRIHAFQACALSHSATSPDRKNRGGNIAAGFPVTTRGSCAAEARDITGRSSIATLAAPGVRHGGTLSDSLSQSASPDSQRLGTITYAFRYHGRLERGEAGGRHGSWAIVMAPRRSDPGHYFDMGAWRPARLILPSGSSVVSAY